MLVARMGIVEALQRRFEREMLECKRCQLVIKQKKESEDDFEKRAWELGDYFTFTRFDRIVKIIVLCEDHMTQSTEVDELAVSVPLAVEELANAS